MPENEIISDNKRYRIVIYHGHKHLIPIEYDNDDLDEDLSSEST